VADKIERLNSQSANVNAIPLADQQRTVRCMPLLKCLFVNVGLQLGCRRGEAASAEPFLTTPHRADDPYAAVRSVDTNLCCCRKQLLVESILDGERLKRETATRRFGKQRRQVNEIEGRQRRRLFALHRLRL
jgi:hypothetical protein